MAKVKIPRGLYLQARVRADGQLLFRWGHAPRLRARGIRPFDLFADGRPLKPAYLTEMGLPEGCALPLADDGTPLLHEGRQEPLKLKAAIMAAEQLTALLDAPGDAHAGNSPAPAPKPRPAARRAFTVGDLLDDFFRPDRNPRLFRRKPATIASYKSWRAPVDEIFRDEPCASMDEDLIEEWFWAQKDARGHRMAYGAYQLLRRAWNWGRKSHRLQELIWSEIDTEKPKLKLRIGTDTELAWLLRACDDPAGLAAELQLPADHRDIPPARPELGDSIVLAIWTVQRARDVLAFDDNTIRSGRFRFTTSKNDQDMDIPITGEILRRRLAAMKARRLKRGAQCRHLILHPDRDAPYNQKDHGNHFRQARALAARFAPSLVGTGVDDWGRKVKTFTFEDCRDTGITRLLRAGCDVLQVASWSNHKDVKALLDLAQAYLDLTGEVADQTGTLLDTHTSGKGLAV